MAPPGGGKETSVPESVTREPSSPRKFSNFREPRADYAVPLLATLVAALFCFDLYALITGISNTINDYFGFRQTQTALTAYWLAKEPHWFAYLTPVLGSPWPIPFEYPVYQWMVVLLMKTGLPIEVAGRIISFAAFIACLVPLRMLARDLKIQNRAFLVVAAVYLASPFYIFYARTFMIETTALLFALCWLAGFVRSRHSPRPLLWLVTLGFGILAGLTKSTTFLGIGPIAGVLFMIDAVSWFRDGRPRPGLRSLIALGLLGLIPIVVCYAWVVASDHFKSANEIGILLTSRGLFGFNFGTWAQRLGLAEPIQKSLRETFGHIGVVLPIFLMLGLFNSKYRFAILAATASYLVAFLIFTGLHTFHTYYHVANAIFLCAAVGLTVDGLIEKGRHKTAMLALASILISQLHFFNEFFWTPIRYDTFGGPTVKAARIAREMTKETDGLLVFGDDWDSTVPFYAERKSLAVPRFAGAVLNRILANPEPFLGGQPLGAIVDCRGSKVWIYPAQMSEAIDIFLANRKTLFSNEWCRVVAP